MTESITITADHAWFSRISKALSLSCDATRGAGDSTSFLSCTHLSVDEEFASMTTESASSTTVVTVDVSDENVSVSGSGECLIVVSTLAGYITQMPSDRQVVLTVDLDNNEFTVSSDDDEVKFSGVLADFSDSERAPRGPSEFADHDLVMDIESAGVLRDAYRAASSMAASSDREALAGQDPKAGCVMIMNDKGLEMFSLFSSASERFLPGSPAVADPKASDAKKDARCLSWPSLTTPRLGVLAGPVSVGVGPGKRLAVSDEYLHIDISPLAIGNRSDSLDPKIMLKVLNPAWNSRVVSVRTPSKEFFSALTRAGSLSSEKVDLTISDTTIKLSSSEGKEASFSQSLACSTQWTTDEHETSLAVKVGTVRKLSTLTGKEGDLLFEIAFKDKSTPWAVIVHENGYDPDDPHDFFMLLAESTSKNQ